MQTSALQYYGSTLASIQEHSSPRGPLGCTKGLLCFDATASKGSGKGWSAFSATATEEMA